jgi:hypothetical protein
MEDSMLIPKVTGPIPVTDISRPLMASYSLDLASLGYIEEEYFISGKANIYNWDAFVLFYQWDANSKLEIITPDFPYTIRILVRRPIKAKKFSGNIILEGIHTFFGGIDIVWGKCHDYIISHGDAWVGISQPAALSTLKTFDPVRYGPIFGTHDGLIWDIISQVGALLKSKSKANPLYGYKVEYLYATGYSQTCALIITYINAMHEVTTVNENKPIYDGYLPFAAGVRPTTKRNLIKQCNVPIIQVQTQSEILSTFVTRRPDGDEYGNRYRRYEIPAATHNYTEPFAYGLPLEDSNRLNVTRIVNKPTGPFILNDFPLHYFLNGAIANLDLWVRSGTPPPKAEWVAVKNGDTSKAAVIMDDFGNAIGGVRTPYVDVPVATYGTGFPDQAGGYKLPFVDALLKKLYRNHDDYVNQVAQSTDKMLKDRWVTSIDAHKIIREAEHSNVLVKRLK